MFTKFFNHLRLMDWYSFVNTSFLVLFGLAALYSLEINVDNPDFSLFKKQLAYFIIGLVLYFIFSSIDYHLWADYYKIVLFLMYLVLGLVLVLGVTVSGTKGWLVFFGQTFQPVELAKLTLIIFLSRYLSQHAKDVYFVKHIIVSGLIAGTLIVLVLLQPDLGSAAILMVTWFVMILFLPLKKKYYLTMFAVIIVLLIAGWFFALKGYQRDRIMTFIQPQRDPLGAGYNVRQSMVAVGSGNVIGRGLSLGSQSQLNFLPAQETDFIFAVISEELGFVGAGFLLLLFGSLFLRMSKLAKETKDGFGTFMIIGILSYMVVQMFINVGMNMGVSPVTGLPLPFVSYGGSSLITTLIAMGIIQNIYIRNKEQYFIKR
jgi:rod shape determining protein RodA